MASSYEIAVDVLRAFGPNVVSRRPPMTYGHYASAIGQEPEKYGLAVGQAMHAIGALCVIHQVPVAPLHWIRSANDSYRGIFESDPLERQKIVESKDIDDMYVVSREYHYTQEEFDGIENALLKSLESGRISDWSPHRLWHLIFVKKPAESSLTYYERAMMHYRALLLEIKARRGGG